MANTDETYAGALGFVGSFFNSDPELAGLIRNAVGGQWDTQRFQAAFMSTNWYRSRSASMRTWEDLRTRDPSEFNLKVAQQKERVRDRAGQLGFNWDESYLHEVASAFLFWGLDEVAQTNFFAERLNYDQLGGTPAAVDMQIQKLAGDYGITVPESNRRDFVNGVVGQRYTEDNVRDWMRDMAKSKYAGMASYLDQGMTVRQVAAPYAASYSNLLEVDPDTVNLNDNLMQQALQGVSPAPGQPPQMQSVYQFERSVRRDPRWLRTKNARDSVTTAAQGVLRDMGLVG